MISCSPVAVTLLHLTVAYLLLLPRLPPHGGLLELRPKPDMGWFCFQRMAQWNGLAAALWEDKAYPANWRKVGDIEGPTQAVMVSC